MNARTVITQRTVSVTMCQYDRCSRRVLNLLVLRSESMSMIRRCIATRDLTSSSWAMSEVIAPSSGCISWFVTMAPWSGTYSFVWLIVTWVLPIMSGSVWNLSVVSRY